MNLSLDLENLTVLILSHQRQHCLNSVLPYWEKFGIKTIVLDNSLEPLQDYSLYKHCTYIHTQENFNIRSKIAANLVKTKYAIVAADDEIYLPTALKNMSHFLDENPDYSSVGGAVLAVWRYGPTIAANWAYRSTSNYHNSETNAHARVAYHTGNGVDPTTSFFTCNMTRVENLVNCLKLYGEAPILATDAISVLSICAAGKSYYTKDLYWIRNWNEFPKSHKGWDRSVYLHDWWNEKRGTQEWRAFYSTLSEFYQKNYNRDDFENTWAMILEASRILQPQVNKKKFKNNSSFITSKSLENVKYLVKKLLNISNMQNSVETLNYMSQHGIHYESSEVNEAIKIVSGINPYTDWSS